jgi:hypothetical protein
VELAAVALVTVAIWLGSRSLALSASLAAVLLAGIACARAVEYLPRRRYYGELQDTLDQVRRVCHACRQIERLGSGTPTPAR